MRTIPARFLVTFFSILLLSLIFSAQQTAFAQSFNYTDFSSTAGLQLNGSAATTLFGQLRMTDNTSGSGHNQTSSVYYTTPVNVFGGFTTTFQFQISNVPNAPGGGGEGLTFIIQNSASGVTAIGNGAGGLSYDSIPKSLVIELDTFLDASTQDSNENHISIHTLGVNPNSANDLTASIGAVSFPTILKDGAVHTIKIDYDSTGGIDIYLDDLITPRLSIVYQIGQAINSPTAYVGFTSSTGTGTAVSTQDIRNWSFSSTAPTSASSSISGQVTTPDGAPLAGAILNLGGANSGVTITDGAGQFHFDNLKTGEFYTVTPEFANYSFAPAARALSLTGSRTDTTFTATPDAVQTANPLDTSLYFVRQQYLDFLGREPDAGGLAYWSSQINSCGSDSACIRQRRLDVSAAFFQSEEFQQTGSFVYRLYKASYGVMPTNQQFTQDRSHIVDGDNLESHKAAFVEEWVARDSFKQVYPDSLTAEEFVIRLMNAAGFPPRTGEWEAYVLMLKSGGTRGQVLTSLINDAGFREREYNSSFVLMQYFGYLRRDADSGGYQFWLDVLNNRVLGNYRSMVCAFLTSSEYQRRFSTVITHSNGECR